MKQFGGQNRGCPIEEGGLAIFSSIIFPPSLRICARLALKGFKGCFIYFEDNVNAMQGSGRPIGGDFNAVVILATFPLRSEHQYVEESLYLRRDEFVELKTRSQTDIA